MIFKQALGRQAVFGLRLVTESVRVEILINLARRGSNLASFVTTLSHHVLIDCLGDLVFIVLSCPSRSV
jgi:hypothetical protein